ncbi:META domain-containing protein [Deinococcus sp. KSM4-11]|uniref:META domain-containing protein n=1 Tax=Deinococcus sp. KSM4-11 TaxID=2568654 RepID=UPI0010A5218F|nr:META domain-containing protein [Deinococcus sp. KSM4-11]THF87229.1 META domain-containing protein [Deinococcus sp. KSM4-11]
MTSLRWGVIVGVLGVSATAQSGSGQIADGTWTLTRLTDASGLSTFGGPGAPTLRLLGTGISTAEGTQVSGFAGCNTFKTTGIFTAQTLQLRAIATTRRLCPVEVMAAEQRYLNVLAQARVFVRQGTTLTLTTGKARATFVYGSDAERSLITEWRLVGAGGGTPLTLRFGADGRVSGSGGCNTFMGRFSVEDDTLAIGPLAATRRACATPDLQRQEQTYLNDLQHVRTFQVGGALLTLVTSTGQALQFARPVH